MLNVDCQDRPGAQDFVHQNAERHFSRLQYDNFVASTQFLLRQFEKLLQVNDRQISPRAG